MRGPVPGSAAIAAAAKEKSRVHSGPAKLNHLGRHPNSSASGVAPPSPFRNERVQRAELNMNSAWRACHVRPPALPTRGSVAALRLLHSPLRALYSPAGPTPTRYSPFANPTAALYSPSDINGPVHAFGVCMAARFASGTRSELRTDRDEWGAIAGNRVQQCGSDGPDPHFFAWRRCPGQLIRSRRLQGAARRRR